IAGARFGPLTLPPFSPLALQIVPALAPADEQPPVSYPYDEQRHSGEGECPHDDQHDAEQNTREVFSHGRFTSEARDPQNRVNGNAVASEPGLRDRFAEG